MARYNQARRGRPFALDGADRLAFDLGGFFDGQPAKETQFDDARGFGVYGFESRQRTIEMDRVHRLELGSRPATSPANSIGIFSTRRPRLIRFRRLESSMAMRRIICAASA